MITHRYHPTFSGSAVQARRLGKQLLSRGWRVRVLTARLRDSAAAREVIDEIPVQRLSVLGVSRSTIQTTFFALGCAVRLPFLGRRFALLHIHGITLFSWIIALTGKLLGKKVIIKMTLLGSDDAITVRDRRFGRLEYSIFSLADAVVSISAPVSGAYLKSGSPPAKLIEMPQGVDTELHRPTTAAEKNALREELDLPSDATYLVFVGALVVRKGADVVIATFVQLAEKWPQLRLLMVGPGNTSLYPHARPAEEESMRLLKQQVVDAELDDRVHYTGLVDNVHDYLRASDVFIFPSRREGFGTVMVEAMATGLPSVVSALDGIAEQVFDSGVNGVIVQGDEPDEYAKAVDEILSSPASAEAMSRAARSRAESRYAIEVVGRLYEQLYFKLLAGEAPGFASGGNQFERVAFESRPTAELIMASEPPGTNESNAPGRVSAQDRYFDTAAVRRDLKSRSLSGGAITMLGQAIRFVMQLGSLAILARVLMPEDFGLVLMVTAITGFIVLFKDMGLSMATIQRTEVNHDQVSTLFWINLGVSAIIAMLLAALSPVISWFYDEPRLTAIVLTLSSAVLISGLSIQHRALLKRQMHFGSLTSIDVLALLASVITAVGAALAGAGYWALVIRQLVQTSVDTIGSWVACGWRPGLPVRGAGSRTLVGFGLDITLYNIVNYFARNTDKILLGRFYDSNVLGLYGNAYQLMMMPVTQIRGPIMSVATPGLSSMQNDPDGFRRYYLRAILMLALITMPLVAFLFVCAEDVIGLLLGEQWSRVIPIFQILAVTAFIQPVETTRGLVMIALGQTRRYLMWGFVTSTAMVLAFVLGLPRGAIGVATAYTIANYVMVFPSLWFCFRGSPITVRAFVSTVARPMVASIVMGGALSLVGTRSSISANW